tara:strand:+ start:406 stop:1620 length:1215 start_codon:yes stop_codon:yes gene_type:complete
MGYKDPIQVAREILERDLEPIQEDVDATEEEFDLDEAAKKANEKHDEDDEDDEDDDEVKEARSSKKEQNDDDEDDDEDDEVDEGELPPWLKKKNGKKKKNGNDEDDDDEDLEEAETILDVDDNQDAEGKKGTPTAKGKKKAPVPKMKPSKTGDATKEKLKGTKEAVEALFSGEDLSEEFQKKATAIFEGAVNEQVTAVEEDLRSQYETLLSENIEKVNEELTSKVDDYLNYVVEEWMKENELSVESGLRTEVSESFMNGLKELFEQHYIQIPDEKYDVLETSLTKITEIETELNEQIEKNIELKKQLLENVCSGTFTEVCDGLVDTEVEKLRSLSEGIEFEDEEQYREKLNLLKESYFDKSNPDASNFEEIVVIDETGDKTEVKGQMADYMKAITKHSKYNKLD